MRRWPVTAGIAAVLLLDVGACADTCSPGEMRGCTITLDGGGSQRGFQSCGGTARWSACYPVGACAAADGGVAVNYSRCDDDAQCGPAACAVCGHYAGVQNPTSVGVCYPFCTVDGDCAPTSAASGVAPRCVLGQCTLLCRTSSACPHDTRCLPWNNPTIGAGYPGYDGLCN